MTISPKVIESSQETLYKLCHLKIRLKLDKNCPSQMKFYHYRHITASPTITELSPDCVDFSFKLSSVVDRIKRASHRRTLQLPLSRSSRFRLSPLISLICTKGKHTTGNQVNIHYKKILSFLSLCITVFLTTGSRIALGRP